MMRQLLCNAATAVAADTAILTPALQLPAAVALLLQQPATRSSQAISAVLSSLKGETKLTASMR